MGQKSPPVAVYTKCGTFTNNVEAINNRCSPQKREGLAAVAMGSSVAP